MSEFNINNLTLDDNSFEVIPDGDYHFTVVSHEVGYATSDKMPPNTQRITCYLEIPYIKDGELKAAKVRNNLHVYAKAFFAIRQFVECIGMVLGKGRVQIDLEKMDGMTGICRLESRESNNGNEYNTVSTFYAPSKAPVVTDNDEAWKRRDELGFSEVDDDDDISKLFDRA